MADKETQTPDFLNMSDEEIANFDPSTLKDDSAGSEEETETEEQEDTSTDAAQDLSADKSVAAEGEEEKEEEESDDTKAEIQEDKDVDPENPDADESKKPDEASKDAKADEAKEQKPKAEEPEKKEEASVNFEAEYKKIMAPFKANGREIQVQSVEDAIALMQMGANYNKKMAALKPNLKLMKLLENNGLLSEEKIGFLIDLEKKNPAAIGKLIKDSGIDPMDLDADKASGYKPQTYTVDDREIELDTVLEDIQDSSAYTRTLEIVSTKWDGASKQIIAKTPQLLKVINAHVESGIYDMIVAEIEREKMFGRLTGLSDIEAYRQVGDAIQARGGFNHLGAKDEKPADKPVVVEPKPKKVDDEKLREKKRAASSTKPASSAPVKTDFNPLSMSDEEFSKQIRNQYL